MLLFDFIKDGCLVDNQHYDVYLVDNPDNKNEYYKVQNHRLDSGEITFDKPPRRRKYNEDEIWSSINSGLGPRMAYILSGE